MTAGTEPANEASNDHAGRKSSVTLSQLQRLLVSRRSDQHEGEIDALSSLIIETIEDLLDCALKRDRNDVGAIEIDAIEGEWQVAIRLTRDATLHSNGCARGRTRAWR